MVRSGKIEIDGRLDNKIDKAALLQHMYAEQMANFLYDLTVLDDVEVAAAVQSALDESGIPLKDMLPNRS